MESGSMPSLRKRVHFSYDEPDSDDDASKRTKKPRFPKGKKDDEGKLQMWDDEGGPVKGKDPRVAAKDRAVRRTHLHEQKLLVKNEEDTSLLSNVEDAEEECEHSDDAEEDGTLLEPFNLKKEREEGYFDADGNYVEYRNNDDFKDAWLDNAEVDTTFAEKHLKGYADLETDKPDLTSAELASIKRQIANALQPGETVLQALRRLKGKSTSKDRRDKPKMSEEIKAVFDQLTEDAMNLLDHGEYDVYNEKRETFQREADGLEAILRARSAFVDPTEVASSSNGSYNVAGTLSQDTGLIHSYGSDVDASNGSQVTGSTSSEGIFVETGKTIGLNCLETVAEKDMFADDDDEEESQVEALPTRGIDPSAATSGPESDGGYVYDESSGYYYNTALGYYYDSKTGLFGNAATGKWYRFEEGSSAYIEVSSGEADGPLNLVREG